MIRLLEFILTLEYFCISEAIIARSATSVLLHNIFDDYDKRIRPYAENSTAVIVHTTVVLGILIEIQENEQVAAYVISHVQRWRDPRLSWNPREYDNVREIIVPQSSLWLPRLFVYNSMNTHNLLEDDKYDVRLRYDGYIKINIPQYVKCICRLSIEDFPFDTQFCAIALASPLLTIQEMDVVSNGPPKDSYFAGNAEWKLSNVTVRHLHFLEEGEYRSEVHFIFHLRRRPVFYIIVIVVPIFLISMLSIMGIFTPGSNEAPRSEKVSLGLGSLLAMTVLLGIIADAMPKSNSIPLLGYYILSVIILCTIAVWVSTTMATIGRKMVSRREVPSLNAYKFAMTRPRLSSTAVPYSSRSSIAISLTSRSASPYGEALRCQGSVADSTPTVGSPILKKRDCSGFLASEKMRNYISFEADPQPATVYSKRPTAKKSLANGGTMPNGKQLLANARRCASVGFTDVPSRIQPYKFGTIPEVNTNIFEEFSENLSRIQELLSILTDSQKFLSRSVNKGRHREMVEREWKRVFYRIEYFFLVLFEFLNLTALLAFLKNAWNEEPKIREPLV